MIKPINIKVVSKEVQPKIYTIIFLIENKYIKHQCVAISLDAALLNARRIVSKSQESNIWWWFTMDFELIKTQLKLIR